MTSEYLKYFMEQDRNIQEGIAQVVSDNEMSGFTPQDNTSPKGCGTCPPNSYCGNVNGTPKCIPIS